MACIYYDKYVDQQKFSCQGCFFFFEQYLNISYSRVCTCTTTATRVLLRARIDHRAYVFARHVTSFTHAHYNRKLGNVNNYTSKQANMGEDYLGKV